MKQIIVVEDDTGILEVFDILLHENYSITGLENGNDILDGLSPMPDLFIVDYQLPGYSGVELCRYIKNHAQLKQVPVLMIEYTVNVYLDYNRRHTNKWHSG